MTPSKAYEIASQWGSAMHAGDPGAVFYSFPPADARPQNEGHRAALLAYADKCLVIARDGGNHTPEDVAQLSALREFFAAWPLAPDEFTAAYIKCALWSSHDDSNESGGDPMDANYSEIDIHPNTLAEMYADCADFQKANAALLTTAYASRNYNASSAGHDFWLTRNHHGAGFWDRGLGETGKELTANAHPYGECDLYIGDDKKVYA